MRNLLIFISKYNAFFLFLIFEVIALVTYIKYNSFQKATFINTTNVVAGRAYAQADQLNSYLSLKEVNDSLALENSRLRSELKSSMFIDTGAQQTVVDTNYKQQYTYIPAKVIKSTISMRNNYITISRGSNDGITKDMGVISSNGVVGLVVQTSPHYSIIQTLLHKDARVSAMLADTRDPGFYIWGDDLDPTKGLLIDVPNHAKPHLSEDVVTANTSLYPVGLPIGKIVNLHAKGGGFFLNMEVKLAVDFSKLQYVYVVKNKFALEQQGLEAQEKKDD
ncbi:rod shape-determining protein MreC [Mucilaginibacter koreensis]